MAKAFVPQADLKARQVTFIQPSLNACAYIAEGDPNSGVIIDSDLMLVIDTTTTSAMAQGLIARIHVITDEPVKHMMPSHYHAVRMLGVSTYFIEGTRNIIVSRGTYEMIVERGEANIKSETERLPRLFAGMETVPGLTWPILVPKRELTLSLDELEVKILHLDPSHTKGDTVVWVPSQKALSSGDLIEYDAACCCGDTQLKKWPATLDALRALGADKLVPGRGPMLLNPGGVGKGLAYTHDFVSTLLQYGKEAIVQRIDPKTATAYVHAAMDPKFDGVSIYRHCLPFDVTRAFDETNGIKHPRIWTAKRDKETWATLRG